VPRTRESLFIQGQAPLTADTPNGEGSVLIQGRSGIPEAKVGNVPSAYERDRFSTLTESQSDNIWSASLLSEAKNVDM
jgi:hypothetical protein